MKTKLCVCGHSEKDHSRITCDQWEEKLNRVGISVDVACDCYNFNPARAEEETPNDCGVYPKDAAECYSFAVSNTGKDRPLALCHIYILQVGAEWLCATDCSFTFGDYTSASGPLSRDRVPHLSHEAALLAGLDRCLGHFHTGPRDGCATPKQVDTSIAMHGKLLAFKASIGGAEVAAALPVGTQLDLFGGVA